MPFQQVVLPGSEMDLNSFETALSLPGHREEKWVSYVSPRLTVCELYRILRIRALLSFAHLVIFLLLCGPTGKMHQNTFLKHRFLIVPGRFEQVVSEAHNMKKHKITNHDCNKKQQAQTTTETTTTTSNNHNNHQ